MITIYNDDLTDWDDISYSIPNSNLKFEEKDRKNYLMNISKIIKLFFRNILRS